MAYTPTPPAAPANSEPTRVIVVDDSPFMRDLISQIVRGEPDMRVVATAEDPYDAREKIKVHSPDVVLLDIEMPRMDGLTFLEKIMRLRPMPVVMVSTLTVAGGEATIKALSLGAVDFVSKPSAQVHPDQVEEFAADIVAKVRIAAASVPGIARRGYLNSLSPPRGTSPTLLKGTDAARAGNGLGEMGVLGASAQNALVAIGASTGGIEAITTVICGLPKAMPPVVIVQHLPQPFTRLFAARLNSLCHLRVKEAEQGDVLHPGHVYIAPGNRHLRVARGVSGYVTLLGDDEPAGGHRPAANPLFSSVAKYAGKDAVGVILSGMGADGAAGLLEMRQAGALTLGQDAGSCVVYGMPRAAWELGAVQRQEPLNTIASAIVACLHTLDNAHASRRA